MILQKLTTMGTVALVSLAMISWSALAGDNQSNSGGKNDGGSGSFDPPQTSGSGSTQHDHSTNAGAGSGGGAAKNDDSHDRAETDAGHHETDHSTTAHGDVEQDQSTYKTRGAKP